ncbi:MAG TPA: sialate O-acetylesterase [Clostridia bacterium]|nr:sialate O-acetylesterase [Clostridia bacterium]
MINKQNKFSKILIAIFVTTLILTITLITACSQNNVGNKNNTGDIQVFQINDTLESSQNKDKPVKVILLGGQSNMSGNSSVAYLSQNLDPTRYATLSAGYSNILINYFNDNGSNSSNNSFVPTSINQGCTTDYFGPELGIAESLKLAYPDETIFILKYAWGGSSLYSQWLSPSSKGDTGPLYTAFVNFVNSSMSYLVSKNYNAKIVAMCWMQGETDAFDDNCQTYGTNTTNLVNDIRQEFSQYISEDGMLFIDAGISDCPTWKNYETINAAKSAHALTSPLNVYIDTIKEGLEYSKEPVGNPDIYHYDSLSGLKLGNLFGEAIIAKLNTINK